MKFLVTGANGFIGRALVRELVSQGHFVRAVVRESVDVAEDVEATVVQDIASYTMWQHTLSEIDVVVHLAGRAHAAIRTDDSSYLRVNVDATRRLAEESAAAGVRRFVFMSSVKVLGESTSDGMAFREGSVPAPEDIYGLSKLLAERELLRISSGTGLPITVLRPPLVYGPGVKGNMMKLFDAVDRGAVLPLGCIRNSRSLVYLGNLVDLTIVAAISGAGAGRIYLVSDLEEVSTPDLLRRIGDALGRRVKLWPVPVSVLRAAAVATGRYAAIRKMTASLVVDPSATCRELAWAPPFRMAEGLVATANWYKRVSAQRTLGGV